MFLVMQCALGFCAGTNIALTVSPLGDVVWQCNMAFHFYADTQLYLSFNSLSGDDQKSSVARVEFCVREIDNWMTINKLKLNRDKTELLVISFKYLPCPSLDSMVFGDYCVCSLITARSIEVVFNQASFVEKHNLCSM